MKDGNSEAMTMVFIAFTLTLVLWLTVFSHDDGPPGIRVLVASSLADVADDLADEWSSTSGLRVELVTGGSNHLAAQVRDGAPVDAFLTADADLFLTADTDLLGEPAIVHELAINHLVVARPAAGPDRIPADLHDPSLVLVACAAVVPCGDAAAERFGDLPVDSYESSARAVVTRLTLDEADLGIVYTTDVAAHAGLVAAWPQEPTCPCVTYSAASLSPSGDPFVAFLGTDRARQILAAHGFDAEPPR